MGLIYRIKRNKVYQKLIYPSRVKTQKKSTDFIPGSLAIMTVFILRENILFLEEWIEHHINMGVDKFVLYDNSKVQINEKDDPKKIAGKVNRHGRNYDELIDDADALEMLKKIQQKFPDKIEIIKWEKKDNNGQVGHFQTEAMNDFVENYKHIYDYALFIDMDEFMISRKKHTLKGIIDQMNKKKITSYYFDSKLFSSRFNNIGKPVRSISKCLPEDREQEGAKTLVKLCATDSVQIHCTKTLLENKFCPNDDMIFYHYCYNYDGSGTNLIDDPNVLNYWP